jgi:hypothetical protein
MSFQVEYEDYSWLNEFLESLDDNMSPRDSDISVHETLIDSNNVVMSSVHNVTANIVAVQTLNLNKTESKNLSSFKDTETNESRIEEECLDDSKFIPDMCFEFPQNVSSIPNEVEDVNNGYSSDEEFKRVGLELMPPHITCGQKDCVKYEICSCRPLSPITRDASVCGCDNCCVGNYCDKWHGREDTRSRYNVEQAYANIDKQFSEINKINLLDNLKPRLGLSRLGYSKRSKRSNGSTGLTESKRSKVATNIDSQEVTLSLNNDVVQSIGKPRYTMSEETRNKKLKNVYTTFCKLTGKHIGLCQCSICRNA